MDNRVLIIQGYKDAIVHFDYNIQFITDRLSSSEVFYLADAKHDLFQESEWVRNKVFSKIISFFAETEPSPEPIGR